MNNFNNGILKIREPKGEVFSAVFAGDVSPKTPESIEVTKNKSNELTREMKPFFESADLRLMQWECAVGNSQSPIDKCGPNLQSPVETLNIGLELNIDVMLLANNHIGDFGPKEVIETINNIKNSNFKYVGAGKDLEDARKTLYLNCCGFRVAIINLAENEFGLADDNKAGVAPMSTLKDLAQIAEAKKNADTVLVAVHGGHECYCYPSPRMVELYRAFVDAGASTVWNCHTHCSLGGEVYKNAVISYSPGNFYFPYDTEKIGTWNNGHVTKFHFDKEGIYMFEILPYQFDVNSITPLKGQDRDMFFEHYKKLSEPIKDKKKLQEYFDAWCSYSGMGQLKRILNISTDLPKDWDFNDRDNILKLMPMRNYFMCESHNDLLKRTLLLLENYKLDEASKLKDEVTALFYPPWTTKKD